MVSGGACDRLRGVRGPKAGEIAGCVRKRKEPTEGIRGLLGRTVFEGRGVRYFSVWVRKRDIPGLKMTFPSTTTSSSLR